MCFTGVHKMSFGYAEVDYKKKCFSQRLVQKFFNFFYGIIIELHLTQKYNHG
jgi:hypothetical protein